MPCSQWGLALDKHTSPVWLEHMNNSHPHILLDVRGLEAPEPLERVLDALAVLPLGQRLCMLIDREPHPLYGILDNNHFQYQVATLPDHRYQILIWHKD